jgi:ubiquinone biosynthesis protein COQ4
MQTSIDSTHNDSTPGYTSEAQAAAAAFDGTVRDRARIGIAALRALMQDPDDTRQVFLLGLVFNARFFPRFLARFATSGDGDELLRDRPAIDSRSVDLDALRALPADSLGGAYIRYLDENGLDPDLFQAPPGLPPVPAFVSQRMRQTHDIWHVLTGYKPDVAGEIALQAFTFGQTRMPSAALIAIGGALRLSRIRPGIVRMALDGYRRGRRASFLPTVRWEQHWRRPVAEMRDELGVAPARVTAVRFARAQIASA